MTILLGLVLLPVLFRTLPKEELGVWLLLGQSWAALGILDLGFGVTITRRIAFAKGRSGSDPNAILTDGTRAEIADLVATGLRIYRALALLSFVVSFGLGFFYLRSLELNSVALPAVWTAWGVLCLSQALTVWASPWTCLLQGVGHVGWDAILASFVSAITIIGQIIAALCSGGLVGLAIVAAAGALLQRTVILGFARRKRPDLFQLRGEWRSGSFHEMLPLAGRAWLTGMGTILVQNTDGLFISSAQGTDHIPAYRAGFIVVLNLHMLAGVLASSSSVFISHLWQAGSISKVHQVVQRNLLLGLGMVLSGGVVILAAGPALFNVWLGSGNYVGGAVMSLFVLLFILEQQTFILSTSCRATNDEAFAGWMMAGGILKLLFAFVLLKWFGLMGLALATVLAQMLTAHWFVVYRSLWRLQISFKWYLVKVALPCLAIALIASGLAFVALQLPGPLADAERLLASSVAGGTAFLISLWIFVLDDRQRTRFRAGLRSAMSVFTSMLK